MLKIANSRDEANVDTVKLQEVATFNFFSNKYNGNKRREKTA